MDKFTATFEYKLIYVFGIRDSKHKGLLKVGDATIKTTKTLQELIPNCTALNQAAKARIDTYTKTADIDYQLLYTELAIMDVIPANKKTKQAFRDYQVHAVLERSGISKEEKSRGKEWFRTDLETVKKAIKAVKENRKSLNTNDISTGNTPIIFRPEQKKAIEETIKNFKSSDRMLWNAKMRFGKTLTSLEVVKRSNYKNVLICTHRPVVSDSWFEDFSKIFYDTNYKFGSKTKGTPIEDLVDGADPFVYFASIQDLRGSSAVGGKFDKNEFIYLIDWDLIIVDEAHEGTQTTLGKTVLDMVMSNSHKKSPKLLSLSGTPFNLADDYKGNEIYTWDYVMEQSAKLEYALKNFGDSNPYAELPEMNMFTYDLNNLIRGYEDIEDQAFNFREFFRTWTGKKEKDFKEIPAGASVGDFVHEADVKAFLNLMTKADDDSNYPFSTEEYRSFFRHTLWMVPGVKEAKALSKLMQSHNVFGSGAFKVVNVAGDGDEEQDSRDALKAVRDSIGDNPDDSYTVTISCGRLTTGVTVPEWTAVMMLSGSFNTSASSYLQTIFRVQTPANINGKIKEKCYVFDFAPDRTLKMVADTVRISTKAGTVQDRDIMGEFLNFCPVVAIHGSSMEKYNVDNMLQQLKRAYTDRVVKNGFDDKHLYNDNLLKIDEIEYQKFEALKKIIGSSKQTKKQEDIDINKQRLTDEEYEKIKAIEKKKPKERTAEELALLEERKKKRDNAQKAMSILRGISIRIPLLIYGANVDKDEEITCDNFVDLVDDSSWEEFMPKDVTKELYKSFSKYYEHDVFISAGRQIRNLALSADSLPPTERVIKIANIFKMFKNPDKETVLTPWRVVNMHLGDCLGGYNFFDEKYEKELEEPRYIDHGKVTQETFSNINAEILEINSKTGLYPLYVVHSIYRARLEKVAEKDRTLEKQKELWVETVQDNMFIICKTEMAKYITKRTLLGYGKGKINAHAFTDLIMQLKEKQDKFIDKVTRRSFWNKENGKMKFDAIVGNPPYQENIENRGEQPPIYHLFYEVSFVLSKKATLITPGRFLFNVGKTPSEWNQKMLNDTHYKVISYYANSKDIFDSVDIKGGVAIGFRNADVKYGAIEFFSPNEKMKEIVAKVKGDDFQSINTILYSNTSYRYAKSFFEENESFEKRVTGGSKRYLSSSVFDKFPEVFYEKATGDVQQYAIIVGRQNAKRKQYYFPMKYLIPPENFRKFKVFLPSSNGSGVFGEVITLPIVAKPLVGATETFISFGSFENRDDAENLLKFFKTKILRALLGTKKVTQGNKSAEVWINVPLQDFTSNSDIDWSKSIAEIDQQLYAKYGLTEEEITFIESMIKPMI